jgi:NADPH2:quinone reductase
MRAWQVTRYGTPTEALELVELPEPEPGPGELVVRATASVCNYNEVDGCHGRYLTINPPLPYTLGMEGLGADVVVNYRETDFPTAVLEQTSGLGADVCFDGVGGEVTMQSLRCLGRGGRHLVIGFASGIEAEEVPMINGRTLCFGNFDLLGVILSYRDPAVPEGMQFDLPVPVPRYNSPSAEQGEAVQAHLVELLAAGRIRPVVGAQVPFEELPRALEDMEARTTTGRVVVGR